MISNLLSFLFAPKLGLTCVVRTTCVKPNFGTDNGKLKTKADLKSFVKSELFQLFTVLNWLTGKKS